MSFAVTRVRSDELMEFMEMDSDIFRLADSFVGLWFEKFESFWIASSGNRVGAVTLGLGMDRWQGASPPLLPGSMYIISLGFLPQYHRQGYGRCALRWLVEYARSNDCPRVVFETREGNAAMRGLAESEGFRLIEVIPEFFPEPLESGFIYEMRS